MSDVYGAGGPGVSQTLWDYLHPGADRNKLQMAAAMQAVNGGPQRSGRPFADISAAAPVQNAFNSVQTQPLPPPPSSAPPSQPAPVIQPPAPLPPDVPPGVAAYVGYGTADYPQSAGGYAPKPPMPTAWPATSTPTGMPSAPQGTPSATPIAAGAGRDIAVNKKPPWDKISAPNQDVVSGGRGGALSDRQMGVFDLSSLFGGGNS